MRNLYSRHEQDSNNKLNTFLFNHTIIPYVSHLPYNIVYVVSVHPLESLSRKAHSNYVGINICSVELRKPGKDISGELRMLQPTKMAIFTFWKVTARFQPVIAHEHTSSP